MSKSSATRPNRESVSKRIGKIATAGIFARDNHRCIYCSQTAEESGARLQLDHLTPRARGGKDEVTNLAACCHRCNRAKSAMTLGQFAAYAAVKFALVVDARAVRAHARRRLPC